MKNENSGMAGFAAALRKMQQNLNSVKPDGKHAKLKCSYISYDELARILTPIFCEYGFSFLHVGIREDDGSHWMVTRLFWSTDDGECHSEDTKIPVIPHNILNSEGKSVNAPMLAIAGAITTAKRIGLKSIIGITEEKTDYADKEDWKTKRNWREEGGYTPPPQPEPVQKRALSYGQYINKQDKWFEDWKTNGLDVTGVAAGLNERFILDEAFALRIQDEYREYLSACTVKPEGKKDETAVVH